jgi:hypothetical protein
MAGRRWGGAGGSNAGGEQHLRPSERAKAHASGGLPRVSKREREQAARAAAAAKRPAPSPEAIARAKERLAPPKAPWHPLPLAELGIVIGMLVMFVGFAIGNVNGAAGGFAITLLGTVEFSWREHRHGYRSHGAVIGGVVGIAVAALCWRFVGLTRDQCAGVGIVAFLIVWWLLTKTYVPREDRETPVVAQDQP